MLSRRGFLGSLLALPSVAETVDQIRRRRASPVDLTRAALARIEAADPQLRAFITVTAAPALAAAELLHAEARRGRLRGPLHGIPVAVKDLYDTGGILTTAGSRQWAERVPKHSAECVRRLEAAGAILLGKLNMDEFAYNFSAETSAYGLCRNPWSRDHSPGGSSGGSAAAVAAGLCPVTLGSDTGGSIRLPAALCGVTGFKPTYGLLPTEGVAPLAWSLDHPGALARTAADCALVTGVLANRPALAVAAPVKALRVGVPRGLYFEGLDAEMAAAFETALGVLGRLTARLADVTLPPLAPAEALPFFPAAYLTVITAEAYAFHEPMRTSTPSLYHPDTLASIDLGKATLTLEYIHARRELDRLRAGAAAWFADADFLVTPTAPGPAFAFGKKDLVYLRNTAPWNLLGFPAISIPCGFTRAGLPLGLQICAAPGRDAAVLSLAAAYQRATDWLDRRPPA